ncbi:NADH-dependent phenylglyoxylate dehydrogenase subunit beta [Candidatus Terasakiella magnetica]|nr:NADH-dependent phenylglyoxylate dehydrogenase subunit beta [Candidatus Terasakiella magnetica]
MPSQDTIRFIPERCDGCGDCMTACAKAKGGASRISIVGSGGGGWDIALCRQCGDPKCVANCPAGALDKHYGSGIVGWSQDLCVDCHLCTIGCAYGGIVFESAAGHVQKCDLCDGTPACVPACGKGALEHLSAAARLHETHADKEDLFVPGLSACQGCNSELLIRHTMRRIGRNSVVAAPPGCIPGMGTVGYNGQTGAKMPIFHPLLTNTAAMLAGVKRQYERRGKDITVVALAGDGGAVDVGFQSLSGAAERGERILFICVDNEGYMNTGMQASGSTPFGSWTSTTPVGTVERGKSTDGKYLPQLMMGHGCAYVATASTAFLDDYHTKLEKALAASRTGFAYLHVHAPCPTGWRFPAAMTTEVCRRQVESNFVTLWEFTAEDGLRFTHAVDRPRPLSDYVGMIGKYKHLGNAEIERIQASVNRRVAFLKGFCRQPSAAE